MATHKSGSKWRTDFNGSMIRMPARGDARATGTLWDVTNTTYLMTSYNFHRDIDLEAFAERNRLCASYFPKIATCDDTERLKLICELSGELFDSWAKRRVRLVKSVDDLHLFWSEQDSYLSMIVFPCLESLSIDEAETEAIALTAAGCKQRWRAEASDRALVASDNSPKCLESIDDELLGFVAEPARADARRTLRFAQATAEFTFLSTCEAADGKRNQIVKSDPSEFGRPPLQDLAALGYARTRLAGFAKVGLSALGDNFGPIQMLAVIDRAIALLCNVCVFKLKPYEDPLVRSNIGLARHCRVSLFEWCRSALREQVPGFEAEAWAVYRDQFSPERVVDQGSLLPGLNDSVDCQGPREIGDLLPPQENRFGNNQPLEHIELRGSGCSSLTNNGSPHVHKRLVNTALVRTWMEEEGFDVPTLASKLAKNARSIRSLLNGGKYHGGRLVTRLASLMDRDVEDLYQS